MTLAEGNRQMQTDVCAGGSSTPGRGLAIDRPAADPGKSSGAGYAESDQSGLVGSDASVMMPFQVQKEERKKRAEQRRTTAFFIRMHPQVENCFFDIWYIDRLNLAICQINFGKDIF